MDDFQVDAAMAELVLANNVQLQRNVQLAIELARVRAELEALKQRERPRPVAVPSE